MTTPADEPPIAAHAYARMIGCDPRSIRRLIDTKGLPAEKIGRTWMLRPSEADAWIADNSVRLSNRKKAARLPAKSPQAPAERPEADPSLNGTGDSTTRHIRRLDAILSAYVDALYGGEFSPQAITGIKQVSAELRMLERHRMTMRQADDELVPRDEHERVVASIGRIIVDEIDAAAPTVPEAMLAALAEAGLEIDSKRGLQVLSAVAVEQALMLRGRIADAIDNSDI